MSSGLHAFRVHAFMGPRVQGPVLSSVPAFMASGSRVHGSLPLSTQLHGTERGSATRLRPDFARHNVPVVWFGTA
eukprot:3936297-Rhodomonas_salina.2